MKNNEPKYKQSTKFRQSVFIQNCLDWWNDKPMVDLQEGLGWANLVMKYYPRKTDCQDVSIEEIIFMYIQENESGK